MYPSCMRKLTCKEEILQSCPGSADSWQGSFAAPVLHVCVGSRLEAVTELVLPPAWLCPMGCVPVSSLGAAHHLLKALLALQSPQLAAFPSWFLEALLKCPQAMLQLLEFSLPKPSWLFWLPQPDLCLIRKSFDDMSQDLKLQHTAAF